jgi:predicted RND superfamily exporter protein
MGIICGGGLLVCLIPMLTMLPVLLLKGRQNVIDHEQGDQLDRRARIENLWLKRPVLVTAITVIISGVAAFHIAKVYFDYDLLQMQSAGLPAVEYERKLLDAADKSLLFGAVTTTNLQEAVALEEKLKQLPVVSSVESITRFISEDQTRKLRLVGEIKQDVAGLDFRNPDPAPIKIQELSATLYSLYGYLGLAYEDVQKEDPALAEQFNSLRETITAFRREMLLGNGAQQETAAHRLASFQRALFNDIRETFTAIKTQDNSAPMGVQDLPPALRNRFVGAHGTYLLMVYPKQDAWKRENQKEFIDQITPIYPDLTGTPVQLFHYTELLKSSYEDAAKYSLAAIVLLVLFHFRSVLCVLLSLVPVAIGALWLGGLMGYYNIPLNPANIMTLPLVIGIGVTNGIHILNRFAEEQNPSILARSTGKAVLVSGLTSIAGFGSLILAQHQGIKSLGLVMSIGLATCMLSGLTFLPALLNLLMQPSVGANRPGVDNARSTPGREEPRSETSSLG